MLYQFAQAATESPLITLLTVLIALAAIAILVVFPIWMLIDAAIKPVNNKVLWILLIVFFGPLPALVYYFTDRKKYLAEQSAVSTPQQQGQSQNQPDSGNAVWPTTSPTANTEAPNPTDKPAGSDDKSVESSNQNPNTPR